MLESLSEAPRFLLHANDRIFGQLGGGKLVGKRRPRCALDRTRPARGSPCAAGG